MMDRGGRKVKQKPSIRKNIFLSNTLIVLVTLGIFLVIFVLFFQLYARKWNYYTEATLTLDDEGTEALRLLQSFDWAQEDCEDAMEELADELMEKNFYLYVQTQDHQVIMEEGVLLDSQEEADGDLWYDMEYYLWPHSEEDGQSFMITSSGGMLVIAMAPEDGALQVYAVSVKDTSGGAVADTFAENLRGYVSLPQIERGTFFALVVILNSLLFVLILCLVSRFFTRRLIRHIMKPLDALEEAAGNMKQGDYTHHISYEGDREFENVCESFNEMQDQVRASKEKQEAYEKARTDMVAGISHDLRTPLTAIRGSVKALQDGIAKTPEMEQKLLDTAYRRTLEMDQLLEQLFYFSKLETGNMPLYTEALEWNAFLEEYVGQLCMGANPDREVLTFSGTDQTVYSLLDHRETIRILDNIVENSRKYAEAEELRIHFELRCEGDQVSLRIADNGVGVPEEKLPFIFDRFYRADESRNKVEGNGLGLHIVRYLTEAMGGSVTAANREGFEVCMVFPVVKEEDAENFDGKQ
ncbi:MAG: HAMP domain-containing histidine kinase [Clostridiales bacterium]|nr:HAMP domain-containing histidine kinase [Clostridiales bacterium]